MGAEGQKEHPMTIGQILTMELQHEAIATRKMLERIPNDKLAWKPHEKSMTTERLAGHIVDMVTWTKETVTKDELDFAAMDYTPKTYTDAAELAADFDANVADAIASLGATTNEILGTNWTLRNGEQVLFTMPKKAVMRFFVMNHIIHHRGQLAVYLRLLDVPVPSIYGPSADEEM